MPIYTYKCNSCEQTFEQFNKIKDREPTVENSCPLCEVKGDIIKFVDAPMTAYSDVTGFHNKIPEGFKDVLREIKKDSGRTSTIDV